MVRRGEYLVQMEDILLLDFICFQRSKAFSLKSPLDAQLVGWIPQLRQVDGHLAGGGVEIASRNQITDVVGIPFFRQLVVEKLDPQRKGIVNANNGLAWQEHVQILTQDLMPVKSWR